MTRILLIFLVLTGVMLTIATVPSLLDESKLAMRGLVNSDLLDVKELRGYVVALPKLDSRGASLRRDRPLLLIVMPRCGSCSANTVDLSGLDRGRNIVLLYAESKTDVTNRPAVTVPFRVFYDPAQQLLPGLAYVHQPTLLLVSHEGRVIEAAAGAEATTMLESYK